MEIEQRALRACLLASLAHLPSIMATTIRITDSSTLEEWGIDPTVSVELAQKLKDVLTAVPDPEKQWFFVSREVSDQTSSIERM